MTDPYAIGEGARRTFNAVRDERDLLRAQVAKLEEQMHELRAYADHADWCEQQVLALCDAATQRNWHDHVGAEWEMVSACTDRCRDVTAWDLDPAEIRAVYGHASTKPAADLERPADAPTPLGATGTTGTARQGVSAPRRRDNGTRATESTPETAQTISEPAASGGEENPTSDLETRATELQGHKVRIKTTPWGSRWTGVITGVGYQGITLDIRHHGKTRWDYNEITEIEDLGMPGRSLP